MVPVRQVMLTTTSVLHSVYEVQTCNNLYYHVIMLCVLQMVAAMAY